MCKRAKTTVVKGVRNHFTCVWWLSCDLLKTTMIAAHSVQQFICIRCFVCLLLRLCYMYNNMRRRLTKQPRLCHQHHEQHICSDNHSDRFFADELLSIFSQQKHSQSLKTIGPKFYGHERTMLYSSERRRKRHSHMQNGKPSTEWLLLWQVWNAYKQDREQFQISGLDLFPKKTTGRRRRSSLLPLTRCHILLQATCSLLPPTIPQTHKARWSY